MMWWKDISYIVPLMSLYLYFILVFITFLSIIYTLSKNALHELNVLNSFIQELFYI